MYNKSINYKCLRKIFLSDALKIGAYSEHYSKISHKPTYFK